MSKSNKKSSSGKAKGTVELDPSVIRFTHARIRPFFTGCGKKIEETIKEIVEGVTSITDLPLITVIENDGSYFSLNNRRLYTIKHIQSLGLLKDNMISVYLKPALEREKKRYTPERCALQAKIMPEREKGDREDDGSESDADVAGDGATEEKASSVTQSNSEENTKSDDVDPAVSPTNVSNSAIASGSKAPKKKGPGASSAAARSTDSAPAKMATALPGEVSKELKELARLVSKGKRKAVLSQLDEWEIAGLLNEAQRDFVLLSIGLK